MLDYHPLLFRLTKKKKKRNKRRRVYRDKPRVDESVVHLFDIHGRAQSVGLSLV